MANQLVGGLLMAAGLALVADGLIPPAAQCATCLPPHIDVKLAPGDKHEFQTAPGAVPSKLECLPCADVSRETTPQASLIPLLPNDPTFDLPDVPLPPVARLVPPYGEVTPRRFSEPVAVPVPGSLALVLPGLLSIIWRRR
jgi:hypothetical protein